MTDLRHSVPGREESLGREPGVLTSAKEGQRGWTSKLCGQPKSRRGGKGGQCGVTGDVKQYQSLPSAYAGASPWGLGAFCQCAAACSEVVLHFSATAELLAAERAIL